MIKREWLQDIRQNMTKEERTKALEKANQIRHERRLLRSRLKSGEISLEDVLMNRDNQVVGQMSVKHLLMSIPGVWDITATKIMEEVGISKNRHVQGLGKLQIADLISMFEKQ